MKKTNQNILGISRRKFLGSSAALIGGSLISPLTTRASAYVAGSDTLKVALIGSGARGTGAVRDAIQTEGPVELVAMADVFRDKIDTSYSNLMNLQGISDYIKVPEEHKFVGLDAYKQAIDLADVVILASPPAFRPFHFEYAVQAGKHVFMEKPVAADAPGVRKVLAAGREADRKGLKVVVGLQNRYGIRQNEFVKRLHDGMIGDITSAKCQYYINEINLVPRKEGQSELEYQLSNWRHFCWLWAGSPAALTIHVTDIINWVKDDYPIRAFGTGGRAVLKEPGHGDIYDHFYIEYEYPDGMRLHSTTRHIPGAWVNRGCYFEGTKGRANHAAWRDSDIKSRDGDELWSYQDTNDPSPFQIENDVLYKAIREDKPHNDTEWGAKSTMTDIMGRMAVHSGGLIEWDEALNSDVVLVPENLTLDSEAPVQPLADGTYPYPIPGSKTGIVIV